MDDRMQTHRQHGCPWLVPCLLLLTLLLMDTALAQAGLDTFGIAQFYPTRPETQQWNSAHWANGIDRTIRYARDPYDPTDWTEDHSASTDGFHVDGNGMMSMSGGGPRFHINSLYGTRVPHQHFVNTEVTAYYRRIGTDGAAYGGMVIGVRTGPLGHASAGGDDCDGTTYYARFRHDGQWDFEKELKHPASTYWSDGGYGTHGTLWGGRPLPENRWVGMKYLAYSVEDDTRVKLELYVDTVSLGNPVGGGTWEKVFELVDEGSWPVPGGADGCSYAETHIILPGNGTALMRTDGDGADYKMVSIREVVPPGSTPVRTRSRMSVPGKAHAPGRLLLDLPCLRLTCTRPVLGVAGAVDLRGRMVAAATGR